MWMKKSFDSFWVLSAYVSQLARIILYKLASIYGCGRHLCMLGTLPDFYMGSFTSQAWVHIVWVY